MLKSFSQGVKHNWRRVLAFLLAVITVIGLLPVTAMAVDGDTGGLNPGSPGGQKPGSTDVAWATDPEQTFLRFTLIEFPCSRVSISPISTLTLERSPWASSP